MKSSKILILVFTLSFPVILYLFLTFYGSNEFDLPVFFESDNEMCKDFQTTENIGDTLIGPNQEIYKLRSILKGRINIVHFPDLKEENQQLKNELSRLLLTFSSEENIMLHALYKKQINPSQGFLMGEEKVVNYKLDSDFYSKLIDCHLALPTKELADEHPAEMELDKNSALVLIDSDGKIRGYYNGLETKDVDRLILEIRILMTKQTI